MCVPLYIGLAIAIALAGEEKAREGEQMVIELSFTFALAGEEKAREGEQMIIELSFTLLPVPANTLEWLN